MRHAGWVAPAVKVNLLNGRLTMTTTSTDRQAFLAAIAARPDDVAPRLIFADWLDENDEPEAAAAYRAATGLRTLRDLVRDALDARQHDLYADDDLRAWAIDRGYARVATFDAECTEAESWRTEWQHGNGASWPCYTLAITVDGRSVGTVDGWHVFAEWDADGNGAGGWERREHDGAYSGSPKFWSPEGFRDPKSAYPHIECGANMSQDLDLPRRDAAGRVLLYDARSVQLALDGASYSADHGDDPDVSELEWSDVPSRGRETVYLVSDGRIEEVEIGLAVAYQTGETYTSHGTPRRTWLLSAWMTDCPLVSGQYDTREGLLDALGELGGVYESYDDAEEAIAE